MHTSITIFQTALFLGCSCKEVEYLIRRRKLRIEHAINKVPYIAVESSYLRTVRI